MMVVLYASCFLLLSGRRLGQEKNAAGPPLPAAISHFRIVFAPTLSYETSRRSVQRAGNPCGGAGPLEGDPKLRLPSPCRRRRRRRFPAQWAAPAERQQGRCSLRKAAGYGGGVREVGWRGGKESPAEPRRLLLLLQAGNGAGSLVGNGAQKGRKGGQKAVWQGPGAAAILPPDCEAPCRAFQRSGPLPLGGAMALQAVLETVERGEQDTVLKVLQIYNQEKSQCFTFEDEEQEERKKLAVLLIQFLERELQPSCQVTCLESIRILSRDRSCLGPFSTMESIKTLARHAGIDYTEEQIQEIPDLDVILEALKCLCNIVFSSHEAQELAFGARLVVGLTDRIKLYNERNLPHDIKFFDLRLLFLLTALRVDIRQQFAQELRGIGLMTDTLELTLGVKWIDPHEVAEEEDPALPLPRQEVERAMEILKVLFNITYDTSKREVDEEDAALYRHLSALLRHCLMISADGEDRTEEFHSHTVNLLGNLPLKCLDVLLLPKVQPGSLEYMGVNMDAVNVLLDFLDRRLDRGHKLKESLTPVLNLLTESARAHRQTRKFLKAKVLPPLRDVKNRPEVGNLLRNKLVRLMTHIDTDVKHCAAEFLFVLCKESVARFVKYTGYGNAAGLLAARGLMAGGRADGEYSEDEDTDTEEYKEAKPNINPITGRVEEKLPNPMEGMTEEQKEYEAMKLVNMFDKLSRQQVIQPMSVTPEGNLTALDLASIEDAVQPADEERASHDSDLPLD